MEGGRQAGREGGREALSLSTYYTICFQSVKQCRTAAHFLVKKEVLAIARVSRVREGRTRS